MQKKVLHVLITFLMIFLCSPEINLKAYASTLSGAVNENEIIEIGKSFRVLDSNTGLPVPNANVSIPSMGVSTKTDSNGYFSLKTNLNGPVILGVNASGYNPFSLTVERENLNKPFIIGLSKKSAHELIVDNTLRHLGDNNYSPNSSNADEFQINAGGSSFTKRFYVDNVDSRGKTSLKIGSVIGLDTLIARKLSGSNINSYSSPVKIYLNSKKVGELKTNGDNLKITFSSSLLIPNSFNEVLIETGQNQASSYTDYDDIELMNIIIVLK